MMIVALQVMTALPDSTLSLLEKAGKAKESSTTSTPMAAHMTSVVRLLTSGTSSSSSSGF